MMVLEDFIKITGKKFYSECLLGGDVLYRMSFFLKQNLAFDRCLSSGGGQLCYNVLSCPQRFCYLPGVYAGRTNSTYPINLFYILRK